MPPYLVTVAGGTGRRAFPRILPAFFKNLIEFCKYIDYHGFVFWGATKPRFRAEELSRTLRPFSFFAIKWPLSLLRQFIPKIWSICQLIVKTEGEFGLIYCASIQLGEEHALLTADNCVGQNKNNAVIQYLMYRVMTGKHKTATLSFMLVGHTKFSPDGYFGLIKKRYRRSKVYTHDDLADIVNSSTTGGFNTCQRYRDGKGNAVIQFRKWSSWLGQIFKKLPEITRYQHFRSNVDKFGEIAAKESVDAKEKKFVLLKKEAGGTEEKLRKGPPAYPPRHLSPQRQWYLYEMIRPHIPIEADKESTAPKPAVPKPKVKKGD